MAKHFKLTGETKVNIMGVTLYRIECTLDFQWAKVGDKGGWVESEDNISGNAWVSGNAEVYGDARVSGNAEVYGDARVSGNAEVYGDAKVYGNAWVSGNAEVYGDARVSGNAEVYGNADYCCFQSFGSRYATTTVFKLKDGSLCIRCGCFAGNLQEFAEAIEKTHGDSKYGKEYRAMIELIKVRFGIE